MSEPLQQPVTTQSGELAQPPFVNFSPAIPANSHQEWCGFDPTAPAGFGQPMFYPSSVPANIQEIQPMFPQCVPSQSDGHRHVYEPSGEGAAGEGPSGSLSSIALWASLPGPALPGQPGSAQEAYQGSEGQPARHNSLEKPEHASSLTMRRGPMVGQM